MSIYNCTVSDRATALCNASINTANIEDMGTLPKIIQEIRKSGCNYNYG